MIWHNSTAQQIADELNSNLQTGLTSGEAELRLKEYGKNELRYKKKFNLAKYFAKSLHNFSSIALIVVAVINLILAVALKLSSKFDYIALILIVLISSFLAALFKFLSDKSIYKARTEHLLDTTVIRNGLEVVVKSCDLVPGDIMLIRAGDYIKADGRLIDSYALTCDETMVSGDPAPAEKMHDALFEDITPLINRHNMVYSGSFVLGGKGVVLITETGLATEVGMRKDMKKQLEVTETPISTRLKRIHKGASIFALITALLLFFIGIIVNFSKNQFAVTVATNLLYVFCAYYSLGFNLIPSILTFSRACAISRLKEKRIIVNSKLTSEELKDVTVICTDKTGVLTTEDLKVVKVFNGLETVDIGENPLDESTAAVLRLALICSNFSHNEHGERHTNNIERSVETACMNSLGMSKTDVDGLYPKIAELPFDSDRMLMTTVTSINSSPVSITKGAPEVLFERCNNINVDEVMELVSSYAKEGLKVIAVAIKQLDEIPVNPNPEDLENDLTFVGIIGIVDKIAPKAARLCIEMAKHGIKTIMVTGDHKDTAVAISKKAGIITDESQAISREELEELSDDELAACINNYTVFARILPEDKMRIVYALKANNEKVLITGDSVKDTQALVDSDFGCALGSTASDMVKDSADLVIEDNHYSSIIYAIKESAKIYSNTKKALLHIFTVGLSVILQAVLGLLLFDKTPLASITLVVHSLLVLLLPLFAIFADNSSFDVDLTAKGNKFFDKFFVLRSAFTSLAISIISLIAFGLNQNSGLFSACGAATIVLIFGEIFNTINIISTKTLFSKRILSHRLSFLICLVAFILLILLVVTPIGASLYLSSFASNAWLLSILAAVLVTVAHESIKLYQKRS